MLHDPADDCRTKLDCNAPPSLSVQNLNTNIFTTSQLNLPNASNESLMKTNNTCTESKQNFSLSISLNAAKSDLFPSSDSVEKLSWKFFEQVNSLDNQLRSDECTPSCDVLSGSGFSLKRFNSDVNLIAAKNRNALGMHSQQSQPAGGQTSPQLQTLPNDFTRKSNGYAINGIIQTTEILSQANGPTKTTTTTTSSTNSTTGDLNLLPRLRLTPLPQQEQPTATTFVFTSPTSTFKRKKQQQLLREEQEVQPEVQQKRLQQREHYNNNLNKIGNSQERPVGTTESATTLNGDYHGRTSIVDITVNTNNRGSNLIPKRQRNSNNNTNNKNSKANDKGTVINSGLGVTQPDTTTTAPSSSALFPSTSGNGSLNRNSTGNRSTRLTFKTHTLPAITKTANNSAFITDCAVDLVAKNPITTKPTTTAITTLKEKDRSKNNKNKLPPSCKRRHRMQASSSGGSGTTTTAKGNSTSSLMDDIEMHLGLIGWRKKCLYALLVLLMLLIIINLGLTLWILKVMEFSTEGMGQLKIVPGGIQLTGQALIMDMLRASTIRSRHGQPISIESSRNFSINTRDTNGMLENRLFLGHDKLECMATSFHINDTNGRNLFSVNRNEVTIGAHALRVDGEGGAIFRESIQTQHVRAEPTHELKLESPTRQLEMTAAKDIKFQSRAGGIEISALKDVKLTSLDGSLYFDSSKIVMPNLRTVQLPLPGTPHIRERQHGVYQLCACANGKLFLADPHSICVGDDTTVCR